MKKIFLLFFLSVFTFADAQEVLKVKQKEKLLESINLLDEYMRTNDVKIVDVVCSDVSFGHSNGWVQSLDDLKNDFSSKKVEYKSIQQIKAPEIKKYKNVVNVRRTIEVSGTYKSKDFVVKLSVLEIWIKKNSIWKLCNRQSVEIKS